VGTLHKKNREKGGFENFKRAVVGVVVYLIAVIGSGGVGVMVMVEVGWGCWCFLFDSGVDCSGVVGGGCFGEWCCRCCFDSRR